MHPKYRIYGRGGDGHLADAQNIECADDQEATNRPSERLSDLLTLSYEPMLAWRLDGAIEFWNTGAERLYGFAPGEAVGRSSHSLLQTKFPIRNFSSCVHCFGTSVPGPESCDISARMATKSLWTAGCSCSAMTPCLRSIATLRTPKRSSLGKQHLSQSETPEGLKRAIEGRIQALANVHSLFVKSRWIGAELSTVAKQELTPYMQNKESRVSIEGPEVLLEPNSAQAIAVTLHELATNAAKYGALSATEGQIEVKWSHTADGRLILLWTETGGPPVKTPTRQGFGGRVIKGMIEQLKGRTRFDWRPEGLICEITLQT